MKALLAANAISLGKVGRGRKISHTSSEEAGSPPWRDLCGNRRTGTHGGVLLRGGAVAIYCLVGQVLRLGLRLVGTPSLVGSGNILLTIGGGFKGHRAQRLRRK